MVPKQAVVASHTTHIVQRALQSSSSSARRSFSSLLEKAARQSTITALHHAVNSGTTTTAAPAIIHTRPPTGSSLPLMLVHVAPAILLAGGTAVVYASALRHPRSSVLTSPLAATTLLLLAVQTSLQPTLSKQFIGAAVDKKAASLVEEIIKTALACGLFFWGQSSSVRRASLHDWSLPSSLTVAGLPAALYAVQGVLTYTAHQHLDAVTFNGLSQTTKTVSAALWCYLLLGQTLSLRQCGAIGILCVAAVTFQGYFLGGGGGVRSLLLQRRRKNQEESTEASSCKSVAGSTADYWYKGIVPCLGATFLSGLAGSLSQRGLQMVGESGGGRNAYLFTIEVSVYSTLSLLLSFVVDKLRRRTLPPSRQDDAFAAPSASPQHHQQKVQQRAATTKTTTAWTAQALIPITLKAAGGVLTALVHKYAGTVAKGFALVLGLVLSGLFQSAWRRQQDSEGGATATAAQLEPHQVIGTLLVLWSTWLHMTA